MYRSNYGEIKWLSFIEVSNIIPVEIGLKQFWLKVSAFHVVKLFCVPFDFH